MNFQVFRGLFLVLAMITTNVTVKPQVSLGTQDRNELQAIRDLEREIENNDLNEVTKLLSAGINVDGLDQRKNTPLIFAAGRGNVSIVTALLEAGADVNYMGDLDQVTPLIAASRFGFTEVVHLLLDAGADPNLQGKERTYALIEGTQMGFTGIVRELLSHGANPNLHAWSDRTPLMLADDSEIVELLLDAKAEIDARDVDERTALFYAIMPINLNKVKKLLELGAKIDIKDVDGISPLIFARQNFLASPKGSGADSYAQVCNLIIESAKKRRSTSRNR
jgi:ankyrin repeat protein